MLCNPTWMWIALLIRVDCRRGASSTFLAADQTKLQQGFAGSAVKSETDTDTPHAYTPSTYNYTNTSTDIETHSRQCCHELKDRHRHRHTKHKNTKTQTHIRPSSTRVFWQCSQVRDRLTDILDKNADITCIVSISDLTLKVVFSNFFIIIFLEEHGYKKELNVKLTNVYCV